MNLKSGGGKAERFHLEDEARERGIEPIVLRPGDDLLELARGAIERGADVIGMAGGDGSQALVASVAMQTRTCRSSCIPAGTRNHFALDLGLDRDDVVGALDAFGDGRRAPHRPGRRSDDRVFVNNVSLGVYAKIVQSDGVPRRQAADDGQAAARAARPRRRALRPALHRPRRRRARRGPDHPGVEQPLRPHPARRLRHPGPARHRPRSGSLTAEVHSAAEVTQLVAAETAGRLQRFRGVLEWDRAGVRGRQRHPGRGRRRRRGAPARPAPSVPQPARRPAGPHPDHRARPLAGRPRRPRPWAGASSPSSEPSPVDPPRSTRTGAEPTVGSGRAAGPGVVPPASGGTP